MSRTESIRRVSAIFGHVALGVVGAGILVVYLGGYVGKKVLQELMQKEAK